MRRKISERRSCELLGISRRWRSYESRRSDRDVSERLMDLARRYATRDDLKQAAVNAWRVVCLIPEKESRFALFKNEKFKLGPTGRE